ncbi:MAG: hypothetical protein IJL43_06760 [Lachnospiraceae bacterium]|nr:hypothetical protein [Lachnospiraceae bacterium]
MTRKDLTDALDHLDDSLLTEALLELELLTEDIQTEQEKKNGPAKRRMLPRLALIAASVSLAFLAGMFVPRLLSGKKPTEAAESPATQKVWERTTEKQPTAAVAPSAPDSTAAIQETTASPTKQHAPGSYSLEDCYSMAAYAKVLPKTLPENCFLKNAFPILPGLPEEEAGLVMQFTEGSEDPAKAHYGGLTITVYPYGGSPLTEFFQKNPAEDLTLAALQPVTTDPLTGEPVLLYSISMILVCRDYTVRYEYQGSDLSVDDFYDMVLSSDYYRHTDNV